MLLNALWIQTDALFKTIFPIGALVQIENIMIILLLDFFFNLRDRREMSMASLHKYPQQSGLSQMAAEKQELNLSFNT